MKVEGMNLQGRWTKSEPFDVEKTKTSLYWKYVMAHLNTDKPISIYLRRRDATHAVFGFDIITDKKCAWFVRYGQIMERKCL